MLAIARPFQLQLILVEEHPHQSAAERTRLLLLPAGEELTISLIPEHEFEAREGGGEDELHFLGGTHAEIAFLLLLLHRSLLHLWK